MTVMASFAMHFAGDGAVCACALRLVPLPPQHAQQQQLLLPGMSSLFGGLLRPAGAMK